MDAPSIPLPLIVGPIGEMRKPTFGATHEALLRDRPGNGVIIGDAQDEPFFSLEGRHDFTF
jgi:hypothetical protein